MFLVIQASVINTVAYAPAATHANLHWSMYEYYHITRYNTYTALDYKAADGGGEYVAPAANFVAVGNNIAYYSNDGSHWTSATTPPSGNFYAVTYGGGKYVAVGGSCAAISTDGINWASAATPPTGSFWGVAYGGGQYVAVKNGSAFFTSPDGSNWTSSSTTLSTSGTWQGITYANSIFVAVNPSHSMIDYSPDGVNWTHASSAPGASYYSVAYGNGTFAAIAQNSG